MNHEIQAARKLLAELREAYQGLPEGIQGQVKCLLREDSLQKQSGDECARRTPPRASAGTRLVRVGAKVKPKADVRSRTSPSRSHHPRPPQRGELSAFSADTASSNLEH
jgi:hypothetical protein